MSAGVCGDGTGGGEGVVRGFLVLWEWWCNNWNWFWHGLTSCDREESEVEDCCEILHAGSIVL